MRAMTWLSVAFILAATPAVAHNINASYTTVIVRADSLFIRIAMDEHELLNGFDLDTNQDGVLWRSEMLAGAPAVSEHLRDNVLRIKADGRLLSLKPRTATVEPGADEGLYLVVPFVAFYTGTPARLDVELDLTPAFGLAHRNLARIMLPDKPLQQAVFARNALQHSFVIRDKPPSAFDRLVQWFQGWFE